jgi:hypothetical protein
MIFNHIQTLSGYAVDTRSQSISPTTFPTSCSTINGEEILKSQVVLRDDASYHCVVVVGPHFIIKHGQEVLEREGQTLLFTEASQQHRHCPKAVCHVSHDIDWAFVPYYAAAERQVT